VGEKEMFVFFVGERGVGGCLGFLWGGWGGGGGGVLFGVYRQ